MTWQERAECRDHPNPSVFDAQEAGTAGHVRAMNLCGVCPVTDECLAEALARSPQLDPGIWGGTTPSERADIRRDRGLLVHGTVSAYTHHRCRCEDCREAKADAQLRHRLGKVA